MFAILHHEFTAFGRMLQCAARFRSRAAFDYQGYPPGFGSGLPGQPLQGYHCSSSLMPLSGRSAPHTKLLYIKETQFG
jgi:hypothetical protein